MDEERPTGRRGISSAAARQASGRGWDEWLAALDAAGARSWDTGRSSPTSSTSTGGDELVAAGDLDRLAAAAGPGGQPG